MSNESLRKRIKESGVRQYEIADYLNISEATFGRMLRKELSEDMAGQVEKAIFALEAAKNGINK